MLFMVVPNGTSEPLSENITSRFVDSPEPGVTTWYKIDPAAFFWGKVTAATDTVQATGEKLATAGGAVLNVGTAIASNLMPILIGVAVLYFFSQWEKFK
jgi:hypothetical protein